jgi:hypothetical protein
MNYSRVYPGGSFIFPFPRGAGKNEYEGAIRKGHLRCSDWDGAETAVACMMTVFVYVHVCVFDRENSIVLGLNASYMKMPDTYSIVFECGQVVTGQSGHSIETRV